MARTISVLYRDTDDAMTEHVFGGENTEGKARLFADERVAEGCTAVVMRCTYPDPQRPRVIHTVWAEPFGDDQPDEPTPTTATRDALTDILTYTIPEILLDVERAYLRGQTLPPEWFVRRLTELEAELSAVL